MGNLNLSKLITKKEMGTNTSKMCAARKRQEQDEEKPTTTENKWNGTKNYWDLEERDVKMHKNYEISPTITKMQKQKLEGFATKLSEENEDENLTSMQEKTFDSKNQGKLPGYLDSSEPIRTLEEIFYSNWQKY